MTSVQEWSNQAKHIPSLNLELYYVKNHPSEMGGMLLEVMHSVVFDAQNSTYNGCFFECLKSLWDF
jgi:hypothetical protein